MSLLNRANTEVIVFPQEAVKDEDGNIRTRPSKHGVRCGAVVQPVSSSIQPPGSGESAKEGYETSELYRLRLVGWKGGVLGPQSQVEWNGERFAIVGNAKQFIGSSRTAHIDYTLNRK